MSREKEKAEMPEIDDMEVTPGSGNIFADLGLPDPELAMAKEKLSIKIELLIKERE